MDVVYKTSFSRARVAALKTEHDVLNATPAEEEGPLVQSDCPAVFEVSTTSLHMALGVAAKWLQSILSE